ncbi:MAG: hypothetical protein Q8R37_03605 [Nanoarchaeota archaeon]|nr:hypothetical protein [Nanoarchaeota archaeon]
MKRSVFSLIGYIVTGCILILMLFHYYLVYSVDSFTMNDFMENPSCCAGLYKNFMGVYQKSSADGFIAIYNHHPVKVIFNQEHTPPRYGEISVYGILQQDGTVKAIDVHNYNYNFILYGISFLAGLLVLFSLCTEWSVTARGFVRRV